MKLTAATRQALDYLRIPIAMIESRGLDEQPEARELQIVDAETPAHRLTPDTANAWQSMQDAAARDGIELEIVSAFRSIRRQVELIERKLCQGQPLEAILTVLAPPGFSEHHTGRAVDIGTLDSPPAMVQFEDTRAFQWLQQNAARYRFSMSFAPDNRFGYQYEPWHWCYQLTVQKV